MEINKQKVMRLMDALGYAESTAGTRMLREAVYIVAERERAMFCKDIYPALGKKYGMTPGAVERAMRAATEKAQRSPSWEYQWKMLGGFNRPHNGEVVRRIVREITELDDAD